jgi:hypothetical protein
MRMSGNTKRHIVGQPLFPDRLEKLSGNVTDEIGKVQYRQRDAEGDLS